MPPPTRFDEASATARQWCTICHTSPRMSVYQPIAVSALEICVAVGSRTDTKLMKLALYAIDETALLLNRSPVGPVPPEFLALLEAILDDIRRHIENAQISTNKRGNLFSRHMSSSHLKNQLKNQLKTMLHGGQLALPTLRENTVEILSPIVGLAALICETAKAVKSNRDAAEELAKRVISVTNCVVERASKTEIFLDTSEDALNGLKGILEDVHSYLIFLNKRRRAMSWMLATQEKDRVAQLNAGLDRALSLFMTTCVLSSNECLRSSNKLVRSNTIQLDLLASTVKQLDGEMSQNFATLTNAVADSSAPHWAAQTRVNTSTSPLRLDECVPTLKPPDGVALAEAYRRLESESDGADGKEALERFVEARTALVAEAERVRRHSTCPTTRRGLHPDDGRAVSYRYNLRSPLVLARSSTHPSVAKRLIAASHAPADVTEGSYSIMDSPYLDISGRSGGTSFLPHTLVDARPLTVLSPSVSTTLTPPLPYRSPTPPPQATTRPSRTSSPSCTPHTPPAWCVGVLATGVYAAGVALVDDELAREKAEELAGGGADAEVDVGEAGAQEQHIAERDPGSTSARGSWKTRIRRGAGADAGAAGADDVLRLDLATSVFTRLGSWVPGRRIGWARAHLRCGLLQSFWEGESAALRACGGGAREARAAEMDGVDARYVYGRCAGVLHAVEVARGAEAEHAEGASARRERADAVHKDKTRTRSRARCRTSTLCPSPALLSEEGPVAEYRCAHCVDVVRLFSMRALERHKCDKHGRARRTGRGWSRSRVEPVSRRSAVEPTPLNPLPE
ncbi:hypothetical protein C8J57DRAFT_1591930 [Mycena rebaudengoi]|nr:hypothetical protein C8J57DRAFT_1591930 [Mycena rebaudengoi]